LVHISTDYVFGLDHYTSPIGEEAAPGPVNIYGLSKLAGEYLARQVLGEKVLIIRTCGLYGHRGSGGKGRHFVETMLRLAQQGQTLRVVYDQICTPSYTADVAEALIRLVECHACGIYHVVNSGSCSWYEFAQAIFRLTGLSPRLEAIRSADYGAAARRPHYSVLSTAKMQRLGLPPLRPWPEALAAYLTEIGYGCSGAPIPSCD
jgi:dTDP-4-dehydrorhamnose reductase